MSGWFILNAPEYNGGNSNFGWWSPIAINHGDSSVFGFCDGHAEKHKWKDEDTFLHYAATEGGSPVYGAQPPRDPMGEDLGWLAQGWAYR